MPAQQPKSDPARRPSPRKTPAEVSAGHQATQARLKQEAAERRAAAKGRAPRASGINRTH